RRRQADQVEIDAPQYHFTRGLGPRRKTVRLALRRNEGVDGIAHPGGVLDLRNRRALDYIEGPPWITLLVPQECDKLRLGLGQLFVAGTIRFIARRMTREDFQQVADAVAVRVLIEDRVEPGVDSRPFPGFAQLLFDRLEPEPECIVRFLEILLAI